MANQNKTDIGLIGLAVMGENLALNMESKGWHVSLQSYRPRSGRRSSRPLYEWSC